jgi:outer membrane protein
MLKRFMRRILTFALAAAPCLAGAQAQQGNESRWRLGASFGYGERSNPLVQSEDIPIVVDLDIAWFGDRWFFDNGDAGLTFADNSKLTASVVGRFNSDRVFFGRTDTQFVTFDAIGMPLSQAVDFKPPDRDYAIELGIELLTDGAWGALQFSVFHDASDTHSGYELFADYSFGWRSHRWYIEPSIGASYKSADLNNYFWGVTPQEAGFVVLPFEPGAGINWHARFVLGYQLNRHWSMTLVAEYERLNDEAALSPIVEEHDVKGVFAGMTWRF